MEWPPTLCARLSLCARQTWPHCILISSANPQPQPCSSRGSQEEESCQICHSDKCQTEKEVLGYSHSEMGMTLQEPDPVRWCVGISLSTCQLPDSRWMSWVSWEHPGCLPTHSTEH